MAASGSVSMGAAAAAVAESGGALLLAAHEPGASRTRFAERLAQAATRDAFEVRWAICSKGDGTPPLWPWRQLLPELSPSDSSLFDEVAACLRDWPASRPLLLVIDDLQWADTGSLLLLRFVARELRGSCVLVLGTYRDVEVPEPVRELLEMQDVTGYGDKLSRCCLLLVLAEARMAAAEIVAARDVYQRAAAMARLANAPELLARAALGVGLATTMGIVDHLEIRLLEEALEAIDDVDGALQSRLLARLAVALHDTASLERRRGLSDQAVAMARRTGDPAALAAVLVDRHAAILMHEPAEARLELASEAARLASMTDDRPLELRARALRMGSLLELGDMDAVGTELEVCESLTEELGLSDRSWHLPMVRSGLAALAGRLDDAERLADLGLRQGVRTRHPGLDVYYGSLIGLIRYLQGRLPELEDALRQRVERYPAVPEWRCTLVLALSDAERHDEARQQFEIVAAEDFALIASHLPRLHTLCLLALACDAAGDARRAEAVYELLAPHRDHLVQMGQTATGCLGSAAHYVGLLCCAMSRWNEAAELFQAAIEMNARAGAVAFVANSRSQLARALRALGAPGAQAQLDRAEETARALGLRLWRGGATPARPGSSLLSPREWEVAKLVPEGLTNSEIAERLHISRRTVETHLDHVRVKLDLGSRAAIASWVVQNT